MMGEEDFLYRLFQFSLAYMQHLYVSLKPPRCNRAKAELHCQVLAWIFSRILWNSTKLDCQFMSASSSRSQIG